MKRFLLKKDKELKKLKLPMAMIADQKEGAIDILTEADLIPDEDVVVTLTMKG